MTTTLPHPPLLLVTPFMVSLSNHASSSPAVRSPDPAAQRHPRAEPALSLPKPVLSLSKEADPAAPITPGAPRTPSPPASRARGFRSPHHRRLPVPAKDHPAEPSATPATKGLHPHHRPTPNPPKMHPAPPQEFFGKTLIAREGPNSAPRPARQITPPFASCSVTMPTHVPA